MASESNTVETGKSRAVVLNSWKEIAQYVGRGVRTVQRWESLGLPARRPHGKSRSSVVAMTDELDAWLRAAPARRLNPPPSKALTQARELIRQNAELRESARRLREDYNRAMATLTATLQTLAEETQRNRRARDGNGNGSLEPEKLASENRVLPFKTTPRIPAELGSLRRRLLP
jgi:hypothetical protein